jgi:hypothetical protein
MGALIMSSMEISWIVFGCVFAGALFGMLLRATLPAQQQSADSKDVLKLLAGLIGTMSALVIGLLIATANSSFATRRSEVAQMAVNIVLLDRGLAHYGPEAKEAREQLRRALTMELEIAWPEDSAVNPASFDPTAAGTGEVVFDKIQELEPQNGRSALAQGAIADDGGKPGADTLAAVRAGRQLDPNTIPCGAGFVAQPHLRQFRSFCAHQLYHGRGAPAGRVISCRRDPSDFGTGPAVR